MSDERREQNFKDRNTSLVCNCNWNEADVLYLHSKEGFKGSYEPGDCWVLTCTECGNIKHIYSQSEYEEILNGKTSTSRI